MDSEHIGDKHLIDCGIENVFLTEGVKVINHTGSGQLEWDPTKVQLHRIKCKVGLDWSLTIDQLNKELAGRTSPNDCVRSYLRKHPELIPPEWRDEPEILFAGTVFCDTNNNRFSRTLYPINGKWQSGNYYYDVHLKGGQRDLVVVVFTE